MSYLRSKSTGRLINRSFERMDCAYYIEEPHIDGGKIQFETGNYEDFIESCEQQTNYKGERLFLDQDGNIYPESGIELVYEEEE